MKFLDLGNPTHILDKNFRRVFFRRWLLPCILTGLISINFCSGTDAANTPFSKGEIITYDIKKFKIKVGEATLAYNGIVQVDNRQAVSITLVAKGFKFLDEEQIFLDPETFYPLLIKRNLNIFGSEEQIIEFYDTQRGKVRVVKRSNGKTSEETIENGGRFDNIYGFIYRQRQIGQFTSNKKFYLHLPTRDVRFEFDKKTKFSVSEKEFDAYYIHSTPKKYKVWFDSSPKKIPLKIVGTIGYGNLAMEFTSHFIKG
jgi:hypothetical protein